MSEKKEVDKKENKNNFFLVDNTGSLSVVYSDPTMESKVQFVWNDESKLFPNKKKTNDDENEFIQSYSW